PQGARGDVHAAQDRDRRVCGHARRSRPAGGRPAARGRREPRLCELVDAEEGGRRVRLGSLAAGGRDGTLVVVSADLTRAVTAHGVARTLQEALDDWTGTEPRLRALGDRLEAGTAEAAFPLDPAALAAPLPRAYQWLDGSAYVNHVELVRRARGVELPPSF